MEEIEISNCCASLKLMGKFVEAWLPVIWGEMEGAFVWIVGRRGAGVAGVSAVADECDWRECVD